MLSSAQVKLNFGFTGNGKSYFLFLPSTLTVEEARSIIMQFLLQKKKILSEIHQKLQRLLEITQFPENLLSVKEKIRGIQYKIEGILNKLNSFSDMTDQELSFLVSRLTFWSADYQVFGEFENQKKLSEFKCFDKEILRIELDCDFLPKAEERSEEYPQGLFFLFPKDFQNNS